MQFLKAACTNLLADKFCKSSTTTFFIRTQHFTYLRAASSCVLLCLVFPWCDTFHLNTVLYFFLSLVAFITLSQLNITLFCYKHSPFYRLAAVIRRSFLKFLGLHWFNRSWGGSITWWAWLLLKVLVQLPQGIYLKLTRWRVSCFLWHL